MSLQAAAQHLASRGRGPDTTLVHMAPGEVAGLQALARAHGGTLTTNPDTGLPEAGFLSNILPMVIGAGLAAATGGTSLALTPGMIGLGIGGLETLRTGSLSKGLMAGLGAYGGAGLGAGLSGLGATAVAPEAMAAANASADPIASLAAVKDAATAAGATAPTGLGALASGAQQAVANPGALINQMGGGSKAMQYGLAAAAPAMMEMPQTITPQGSGPNPYEYTYDPNTQRYTRVPVGTRQRDVLQPIQTITTMAGGGPVGEMSDRNEALTLMANGGQMYAAGGQINLQGTLNLSGGDSGGQFGQAAPNGYQPMGSGGGFSYSQRAMQAFANPTAFGLDPRAMQANPQEAMRVMQEAQQREITMPGSTFLSQGMATGGMTHLGDYSDGGRLLKGPGDGVSDSIPATIADKRPARLADGEFVVPARIVSELGNGSTDAGARKLYAMMDRIQKARGKTTGKDRVAVNSRADKALPA